MKKLMNFLLFFCAFSVLASDYEQWQIQELPGKPSLRGSAIKDGVIWVTGTNNSVFISTDNGQHWKNVSVKAALVTDFRDIHVFDANTAIVMGVGTGESSILYITEDQGKSWQVLFENPDSEGFFNSIDFWDRQNGLLLGDPVDGYYVVMKTHDGGKSWQRIAKNKLPGKLNKEAAFAASGNTLIIGKEGQAFFTTGGFEASVYHSENYGNLWQRRRVPLHTQAKYAGGYGLSLNQQGTVFVVGGDFENRDKPYKNIAFFDSGKWKNPNAPMTGLRTAMQCANSVCISTGKLFTDISLDNGKNWNNLSINGQSQGFYTLAQENGVFIGAGHDGRVGVIKAN